MRIGVPRERAPGERRVAATPETVQRLAKAGFEVSVEAGAGAEAGFPDAEYVAKGARIEADARALCASAEIVLRVSKPSNDEVDILREGTILVAVLTPLANRDLVERLARRKVTVLAMDLVPRITRAQSMDVLSSQSMVAGYRAVILAAEALPRMFPLLMTAAGTLPAARCLVLGAGVAGLQAIASARRFGAVVEGYDVRAAAREQVQSLGAKFVEMPTPKDAEVAGGYARALTADEQAQQRDLLAKHVAQSDVVICTALVPGRRAPTLVTADAVRGMRAGSVIVDLAAEAGGNCELTAPGERVVRHGVTIIGATNLAAMVPHDASQMFARNAAALLLSVWKDGALHLDTSDEVVAGVLVTRDGAVVHPSLAKPVAQGVA